MLPVMDPQSGAGNDRWLHDWRRHDFDMPNNAGQSKRKQRRTESLWINW